MRTREVLQTEQAHESITRVVVSKQRKDDHHGRMLSFSRQNPSTQTKYSRPSFLSNQQPSHDQQRKQSKGRSITPVAWKEEDYDARLNINPTSPHRNINRTHGQISLVKQKLDRVTNTINRNEPPCSTLIRTRSRTQKKKKI